MVKIMDAEWNVNGNYASFHMIPIQFCLAFCRRHRARLHHAQGNMKVYIKVEKID